MKNNNFIILMILIIMTLPFTGCTSTDTGIQETISASAEETLVISEEKLKEKDIIPIHEITVPSYLQGSETASFSIIKESEDSVTYQFTGNQQIEALDQISVQTKDDINQILHDKKYYPNIASIAVNKDFSKFDVTFLGTEINTYETTLRMSLYIAGDRFQLYQGNPESNLLTVVNYINDSTGKVFSTGDSGSLR